MAKGKFTKSKTAGRASNFIRGSRGGGGSNTGGGGAATAGDI